MGRVKTASLASASHNRKDIEFLQLSKLKNTKMAKKKSNKNMKKGKEHHWHVPDDQKVAKKAYVPTGKPRGRPPKAGGPAKAYVPSGKPRGRPSSKNKE